MLPTLLNPLMQFLGVDLIALLLIVLIIIFIVKE